MRIAVMQPYFCPYLGYFELMKYADIFVVYDCVQHIRRGFVHRNRLRDCNGNLQWITLPLEKAPQETPIHQIKFAVDARERMAVQMRRFPAIERLPVHIQAELRLTHGSVVTYLVGLLEACAWELGLGQIKFAYSSGLGLPDELKGQDRILAICKRLGATEYLNAPGGRSLYDEAAFADRGIKLEFLPEWQGSFDSVLETIAGQERAAA